MKPFWNKKHVFITGATGFLGSWLVKALLPLGARIIVLVRNFNPCRCRLSQEELSRLEIVPGKLEDYDLLERVINEYEIDTVFHLAAQTLVEVALRNPFSTFESNVRGTYHILEACRQNEKLVQRIVIASSDKAYGESVVLPYLEGMPLQGRAPYDVSKSCTDLLSLSYAHTYRLPLAISRCGNLYGGGDFHWSRIIPGTIRSLWHKERPVIRSNGKLTRDYLFVEDAVEAYLQLAMQISSPGVSGQAFNFGPSKAYNVLEIVQRLQHLMNCNHLEPKILDQARSEIRDQMLDSSKARALLQWKPNHSLEEGLKETVEWYASYWRQANLAVCDLYRAQNLAERGIC